MLQKLKQKWHIQSNFQLVIICIVFAINGSLSAKIGAYFLKLLSLDSATLGGFWFWVLLLLIVLPVYPFLLMCIGYLFGQSGFFVPFGKKMIQKIFFFK